MSILSTSPQDNRLFNAEIASKLGDINAAVIVQQLHYWMGKEGVGTVIKGVKFIYNSFNDWVKQFPWLSVWQFRKAMKLLRDLEIVKVIRYKAKCWNQTNYYTLDSDRLKEHLNLKTAESTENSELCVTTDRDVNIQQIEVRDNKLSYIESKNTNQKEATKSKETNIKRSLLEKKSNSIAAAPFENDSEEDNLPKREVHPQAELNGLARQNKLNSESSQTVITEGSKLGNRSINVNKRINSKWKSLVEELDGIGVPINKTLVSLVKMYEEEEVREAISQRSATKVIPSGTEEIASEPQINLEKRIILPCFIDLHTHLDKGHIWERSPNLRGTFDRALDKAIADSQKYWQSKDIYRRMEFSLKCAYAYGTKAIRTHIDSFGKQAQISFDVFTALKQQWSKKIELQAVSLVSLDYYQTDAGIPLAELIKNANGILGGVAYIQPKIDAQIDNLFKIALERNLDLDLHLDENNDPDSICLQKIAQAAIKHNFPHKIVCGHCCSLAVQSPATVAKTIDLVKKAGITVVSLPMCNLYLQGRQYNHSQKPVTPFWRGVTKVHELHKKGLP